MNEYERAEESAPGLRLHSVKPKPARMVAPSTELSGLQPLLLGAAGLTQLQRLAGNASVVQLIQEERSPRSDATAERGGSPLDASTRTFMEERLGADFGDVRIHSDSEATESAKSLDARAYTVGNSVVFQSGEYTPETDPGIRTLAHELAHVVQQRNGPVDGTPMSDGINISDPWDRFEQMAESSADSVLSKDKEGVKRGAK